ncbi:hypothetical protein [Glycomyces sp. YM15]|uniref:hypothetical protein n=1 Tax=Glycomyces sp. YM15 TaxID=2800446 RepID=UPI0019667210|nr:hypothetical protein [Glycomyces sp. YM15]
MRALPLTLALTIISWVLIFQLDDPAWWLWLLAILISLIFAAMIILPLIPRRRDEDKDYALSAGADPEILAAIASLAAAGAVVLKEAVKQIGMTIRTSMREKTIRQAQPGGSLPQRQIEGDDSPEDEDPTP